MNTFYRGDEIDKKTPLKNLKERLYCAVLDNSTSIFELTFLGIPCFTSSANFGYKLKNNDLSKIEDIYYADKYEMKQWYNEMAHTELSRRWIGKLVGLFRGWMVPGYRRRFGHGNVFVNPEEAHIDEELGTVTQGMYISFWNFILIIIKYNTSIIIF